MLSWLDPDPSRAIIDAACLVFAAALGIWLVPRQARLVRRHGGRPAAVVVTVTGTLCLLVSLQPVLVTTNTSAMLLIIGLAIAFRPEAIVSITGGPTHAWTALKAGTGLLRILADLPGRAAAERDRAVAEALQMLEAARDETTMVYVDAVRATAVADTTASGAGVDPERMAQAEAVLRRSLWGRPSFEPRAADPGPGA